jgi:hypothetical protein
VSLRAFCDSYYANVYWTGLGRYWGHRKLFLGRTERHGFLALIRRVFRIDDRALKCATSPNDSTVQQVTPSIQKYVIPL